MDEHIAPPETRVEYLHGVELFAAPAREPHGTQHFDLTYVLGAHAAKGYRGAVDMLTRTGEASDFAPDASIFPSEPDIATGGRRLEELAFEITDQQAISVPTAKARELARRGVRRVFCVLVKKRQLLEWSTETDGWKPLSDAETIEDPCLARPLPVRSLFDAAAADAAVVEALIARKVPALEEALAGREASGRNEGLREGRVEGRKEGEKEGRKEGQADRIIHLLEARFGPLSKQLKNQVRSGEESDFDRWFDRILTASTADEVLRP